MSNSEGNTLPSWRDEFRQFLKGSHGDVNRTHLIEISRMIREGLDDFAEPPGKLIYEGDSLSMSFNFADGKRYSINVREIRVKDEGNEV